jgi:glycosyltransferase involved in cell wall biosynthesis
VRILQVITDTDRRGAQVFAMDLATAMSALGHQVETVALASGRLASALEVDVLGPRRRSPSTLLALRRLMGTVDVTIAHGSATGLACALAGGGGRRPFAYRQISDTRFWANSWFRRQRVSRYLRRARVVVALSEGAKSDLVGHLGLPHELIEVVPNAVPVGSFHTAALVERVTAREHLGLPVDAFVALYVGAFVPEKGADVAVEAVGQLDDVHLAMVGDGPERQSLERLAERVRGGRVRFTGTLSDTLPAYSAADVVLLPSKGGDSMPATLIEAGLCGLPSIATPIGSIEDIVLDQQTGLIVRPDDVGDLRRAIEQLRDDHVFRERLSSSARTHCLERFEIGVVAERWLAVLHSALE